MVEDEVRLEEDLHNPLGAKENAPPPLAAASCRWLSPPPSAAASSALPQIPRTNSFGATNGDQLSLKFSPSLEPSVGFPGNKERHTSSKNLWRLRNLMSLIYHYARLSLVVICDE